MSALLHDLRHGIRLLFRAPGFSAVAIAALAIGIGANTAIFSVVNTLLLRDLPYRDADTLAIVWEHNIPRDRRSNVAAPGNFIHWREMNQVFDDLAAVSLTYRITITGRGEPEELAVQLVTAPFFSILGVAPQIGRPFSVEEDQPRSRVAVISDRLWRRKLGGDPNVLQQPITLQGNPVTVVGVMPPGFSFFDKSVDVWIPAGFTAESRTPRGRWLQVVGRLKPGVTIEAAQRDMQRVSGELTKLFPEFNSGWTSRVVPVREQWTGEIRPALVVLLGAVAFVLLIACANVANLLLARATSRQRELAVRAALGAGRARLIRQMLAESLVVAICGGVAGLGLAWWAVHFLRSVVAERLPVQRLEAVGIDAWVLLFTLGTSVVSGLAFGAAPAFTAAGSSLGAALKEGGRTGSSPRARLTRSVFVIAEIALALVLLVGAGLLIRSFVRLLGVDAGFDTTRTVTMRLNLPAVRYGDDGRSAQFFGRIFEEIDALPAVQSAGAISFLPLAGPASATSFEVVGKPRPPLGQEPVTEVRVITHRYLQAMGVPLIRGRFFNDNEVLDSKDKIIVNDTMARRYWPGEDPLGKRVKISWTDDREDEIIGVVGDTKDLGLDSAPRPTIYWPYPRYPYGSMTLAVRTANDPASLVRSVVSVIREQDPALAVADIRTMDVVVADSIAQRRLTMLLLSVFAAAALLLAAVGVYGVIAYSVTQRTQEIGIRMALGARRADVLRMILGQAGLLALSGIAIGAAGALALTRFMKGMLFEIDAGDPVTFVVVAGVLGSIALLASYIPGMRATRVDPVVALRAE